MKQTIRVERIVIRVPGGAGARGEDLAREVTRRIGTRAGRPVPEGIQRVLSSRLSAARKGNR